MGRVISRKESIVIINMLRQRCPLLFEDFKDALGLREFELKKLLKTLVIEKVIIRESFSGEEKFWLNEAQAFDFLKRNPIQKKRLKHPK